MKRPSNMLLFSLLLPVVFAAPLPSSTNSHMTSGSAANTTELHSRSSGLEFASEMGHAILNAFFIRDDRHQDQDQDQDQGRDQSVSKPSMVEGEEEDLHTHTGQDSPDTEMETGSRDWEDERHEVQERSPTEAEEGKQNFMAVPGFMLADEVASSMARTMGQSETGAGAGAGAGAGGPGDDDENHKRKREVSLSQSIAEIFGDTLRGTRERGIFDALRTGMGLGMRKRRTRMIRRSKHLHP